MWSLRFHPRSGRKRNHFHSETPNRLKEFSKVLHNFIKLLMITSFIGIFLDHLSRMWFLLRVFQYSFVWQLDFVLLNVWWSLNNRLLYEFLMRNLKICLNDRCRIPLHFLIKVMYKLKLIFKIFIFSCS